MEHTLDIEIFTPAAQEDATETKTALQAAINGLRSAAQFAILEYTLEIDKYKMNVKTRTSKKEKLDSVEDEVFEKFRALRFEIASKNEIPAYIVFSDKTLIEFASKLPQNREEMLDVNGVGEVKYERYGEEFLTLCRELIEK